MRVVITGVAGFVGRHLATHLLTLGDDDVWGLARPASNLVGLAPEVRLVMADLSEREQVVAALREARPDAVYHLAAQSSVARSLADPLPTVLNNVIGQINLFEAIVEVGLAPRILIVGSNEEYGLTRPDELPIVETKELRPISPYAVSKVTQDLLAHQYFATRSLPIVRVRPFPHTGPGQADLFVTPSFARQIAEMELGVREPIMQVGYLEGRRDFTDVRDVVRGYRLILRHGAPGDVYNLGSEQARSTRGILDGLLALSDARPRVEVDPSRIRPLEVPVQYCDCSKLRAATGWRPQIAFEQTLSDILEEWRRKVRAPS